MEVSLLRTATCSISEWQWRADGIIADRKGHVGICPESEALLVLAIRVSL